MNFNQGDIVWADFGPVKGHEQDGRRPALIISNRLLNQTGMYSVCPISTTSRRYPTYIELDRRTKTNGVIMTDQNRTVNLEKRNAKKIEECPFDILEEVIRTIDELHAIL